MPKIAKLTALCKHMAKPLNESSALYKHTTTTTKHKQQQLKQQKLIFNFPLRRLCIGALLVFNYSRKLSTILKITQLTNLPILVRLELEDY